MVRLAIDLQGCQTPGSRHRGIGRYSLGFSQALVRNAPTDEVFIVLNGVFGETIGAVREAFDGLLPQENIRIWSGLEQVAEMHPGNQWRRSASEHIRNAFIRLLRPDVLHISSVFEGLGDNAVTSVPPASEIDATSVTLYDLIPLVRKEHYLADPTAAGWYQRRIEHVRRAKLFLAISESTRREAINILGLPADFCINVSAGIGPHFRKMVLPCRAREHFRTRYGLLRPFIMYTGGIDHRKNIEGLISAFASIPETLRSRYQLAIVCSINPDQRQQLLKLVRRCGLQPGDVVLTGFVPEPEMVQLYNICHLFVFPSLHEGFGLPVLEAMACGAPVIGSNCSSVPEIIGRQDALFDPRDTAAIAAGIIRVLGDEPFRLQLASHGIAAASKYSWDKSAKLAIEAFRSLAADNKRTPQATPLRREAKRPSLAFISPLPPDRSGIADYSSNLLPALARHYDICVVDRTSNALETWSQRGYRTAALDEFERSGPSFDRILYHFGNSSFHTHMWDLLRRHPGVVVLHDFFLSGLVAFKDVTGDSPGLFGRVLARDHGYQAYIERMAAESWQEIAWRYPCSAEILSDAMGVIVHSRYAIALAKTWYGEQFSDKIRALPFCRGLAPHTDKHGTRGELGIAADAFVVCSFGMLGPTKLNHRLIDCWTQSSLSSDPRCRLIFVGAHPDTEYAELLDTKIGRSGSIRITGHVDAASYARYLAAADVGVQLRAVSRGETSAAVFDCLSAGKATIVNAHGSMAELPADCVRLIPDEFATEDLVAALEELHGQPTALEALGERALGWVGRDHAPEIVAAKYASAIESFYAAGPESERRRLLKNIVAINGAKPPSSTDLLETATAIADSLPTSRRRQLLLDVSAFVPDLSSTTPTVASQSIVRNLLCIRHPLYIVKPVYASDRGYRYANQFALEVLGAPNKTLPDELIDWQSNDIFAILAPSPSRSDVTRLALQAMRNGGVRVVAVLDHETAASQGPAYVHVRFDLAASADAVLSTSCCVTRSFLDWLDGAQPDRYRPLKISEVLREEPSAVGGTATSIIESPSPVLALIAGGRAVLVQGDVTARNAHGKVLYAFERLWADGNDICLIVMGTLSGMAVGTTSPIFDHPELGKRLFCLDRPNIDAMNEIFRRAIGCIVADDEPAQLASIARGIHLDRPLLIRDVPLYRDSAGNRASYFSDDSPLGLSETIAQWIRQLPAAETAASRNGSNEPDDPRALLDAIIDRRWQQIWTPSRQWRYRADSARLFTQVGRSFCGYLQTNERAGWMLFGPYSNVRAGRYRLEIEGWLARSAGAVVQIAGERGSVVFAAIVLSERPTPYIRNTKLLDAEFCLVRDCSDLEVRVSVSDASILGIATIKWQAIDASDEDACPQEHAPAA